MWFKRALCDFHLPVHIRRKDVAEGRAFEDATPDVSSMIMNSMQMKLDDVHAAYESAWQNCCLVSLCIVTGVLEDLGFGNSEFGDFALKTHFIHFALESDFGIFGRQISCQGAATGAPASTRCCKNGG